MSKYARNRYSKKRINQPYAPKVTKAELSEKHFWPRLIIALVLLVLGAGGIAYAISGLVTKSSGWQEISVSSSDDVGCSSDFTLNYNLGASGVSAGMENRAVTAVYKEACVYAYQAFDSFDEVEGVGNLASLNNNPNTVVEIEPVLYQALETLQSVGSRHIYLGPIYRVIDDMAMCENDVLAADYDPARNTEMKEFFDTILTFANDPSSINIVLLGDNKAKLAVSDEYMAYYEDSAISTLVDLHYMADAFRCDYIADQLIAEGHTYGVLTSFNGYTRYLNDGTDADYEYNLNIFDREGNVVRTAATVSYSGMHSCVVLRDFPLTEVDQYWYYVFEDGEIWAPQVNPADGSCDMSVPWCAGFSDKLSCGELLASMLAETVDGEAEPSFNGIYSIYCYNRAIKSNLPNAEISEVFDKENITYSVEQK